MSSTGLGSTNELFLTFIDHQTSTQKPIHKIIDQKYDLSCIPIVPDTIITKFDTVSLLWLIKSSAVS